MDLVFIHGVPASGKLTTARALEHLVDYPVFHNHLVVDTLTTVFPFGSEPFVRLREKFWLEVFSDAAGTDQSLTFTFAPEPTVSVGFSSQARHVIERSGGSVHFVRLAVSETEQDRRIGNDDRREFRKLSDLETLRRSRNDAHGAVERPPVDLEIDTERSTARESAALIVSHFALQKASPTARYPQV